MSKIQFITLIVTLVGVQVGSQYFFYHGHDVHNYEIASLSDTHSDQSSELNKTPILIANKLSAESEKFVQCEGGGVDYLADRINEIAYLLESFSDRIDDLSEFNHGNDIGSHDALKNPELSEDEIYSVYKKALGIMEGISLDSNSKDLFDKEGEVMGLLSTIPASRRSEFHKKLF